MRRALTVFCLGALTASGLALGGPATAAPAEQASPTAAAAVPDELVVGYVAGASDADRGRARSSVSARLLERVVAAASDRVEVERVVLPPGRDRGQGIAALRNDPAVAYAEPNWIYTKQGRPAAEGKPGSGSGTVTPTIGSAGADIVQDPLFVDGTLWGMYGSGTVPRNDFGANAAAAWSQGSTGSASVVVGIIDEGIQYEHPDLLGQVRNPGEIAGDLLDNDRNGKIDDSYGWDFVDENASVYDGSPQSPNVDAHGTHVAGTIGGKTDTVGVVGVNQNVTMISGKFLAPNGGSLADAVQAVDYFTDLKVSRGLNVVATSNSWGGGGYSQALLDAIVRAAKQQILFVAAAGNSGTNNDRRASYPSNYSTQSGAGYDAVIAVAAIDRTGALASFSQYGATTVDLGAPGVAITSSVPVNGYASYNGTSMATPHVTGAVALYEAAKGSPTAAQTRTAILSGGVPTASLSGKTATGRRLDVAGALVK